MPRVFGFDQGKKVRIVEAVPLSIQRSFAHSAYHVGQMMLIARVLAGDQVGRIVTTCNVPKKEDVEEKWIHRLWAPYSWHVIPEPNLAKLDEHVAIGFANKV